MSIKEVSKARPCPICGKPDYCCFIIANDGSEMVVCKRNKDESNVIGRDGAFYIYVRISVGGNAIFEEANQRRAKEIARKGSCSEPDFKKSAQPPVAKQLTVVDKVEPLPNKTLDKIYRTMVSFLYLEDRDREYLYREGWTDDLIKRNRIVSFPEKDFTRFKYRKDFNIKNPYRKKLAQLVMDALGIDNLRGVPGAFRDSNGKWTFAGPSGILFPLYDANHLLYRLRIRMDFRDVDAIIHQGNDGEDDWFSYGSEDKIYVCYSGLYVLKQTKEGLKKEFLKEISNGKVSRKVSGKYRNLASYSIDENEEKRGFIVNTYESGCESGNQLGFYYDERRDDMYILYATEGEKKGIFSNDKLRAPFVSFPGVNSWRLLFTGKKGERPIDIMKAKGVKIIVVAYDADKTVNDNVLAAERQVIQALKNEGLMLGVADWDITFGKGLDDLLNNGYKPRYALA